MKSGGGTATTTQSTQMPAWLDNYSQQTLNRADEVTSRPWEGFDGQRIEGFTPDQLAAQQAIRAQQGQTGAALGTLGSMAQGMAGFRPDSVAAGTLPGTNLDQYMNPYLANVEQQGLAAIDRSRRMTDNQIADRAIAGGAFGGSRFALQQAENAKNAMQQSGELSNQIRAQGFQNAQQMATQDINRQMQAGMFNSQQGLAGQQAALGALGMAGNLYQGQQQAQYGDIAALAGSGAQQQTLGQAGLDVAYQDWLAKQGWDQQQLMLRSQIGAGVPHGSTTTQTQPLSKGNPAMGALGGAMSGFGVAGPWGALAGGILGGLASR